MSENNRPVGDALAVLERGPRERADFAPLGPVWLSEKGNLNITMQTEPLAWRDPATRRVILIRLRDGVQVVQQGGRVDSRSYAPPTTQVAPARNGAPPEDDIPFDPSSGDVSVDVDVP